MGAAPGLLARMDGILSTDPVDSHLSYVFLQLISNLSSNNVPSATIYSISGGTWLEMVVIHRPCTCTHTLRLAPIFPNLSCTRFS